MKRIFQLLLVFCPFAIQFQANAQSESLPYHMGFDSFTEVLQWDQYRLGSTEFYDWNLLSGTDGFASHDYPVGASVNDTTYDWLVSPPLNVTGDAKLSFDCTYFYFTLNTETDYFGIWISSGSGDPNDGDFIEVADLTDQPSGPVTEFENILLPLTGDSVYIAFVYKETQNWYTVLIDNIDVELLNTNEIDNESKSDFVVFPNPVNDVLSVKANLSAHQTYSLYDISGKKVACESLNGSVNIDTKDLCAGVYFLEINNGGKIIKQKILKN